MFGLHQSPSLWLASGVPGWLLFSGFTVMMMISQVNRKLSTEKRLSHFFLRPGRIRHIRREYQRLYPKGEFALLYFICNSVAGTFLLASIWLALK
jgi:hypothetical protein